MKTPKNFLRWTFAALLCVVFTYCQRDPRNDSEGSVIFKFGAQKNLKSMNTEPEAAAVIVSIMQGSQVIFDKKKLELTFMNGSYLSKGISIPGGSYKLTEFLVTDSANHVIYATPIAGSPLAQLVNNPLPISFDVGTNTEQILTPEVIATDTIQPADLGYAAFSFNPVKTIKFYVTPYTSNGNPSLIPLDSAQLSVSSPSGKNYWFLLSKNKPNFIQVKADTGKFILRVTKDEYTSWIDTLTETELKNNTIAPILPAIPNESKSIWLKSMYEVTYSPEITTYYDTEFLVDWGNGDTGVVRTTNCHLQFYKAYTNFFKITGDMRSIRILKSQSAAPSEMNIQSATRLEELIFTTTLSSSEQAQIDISANNKLRTLELGGQNVVFGDNPYLTSIKQNYGLINFAGLLKSVEKFPRKGSIHFTVPYGPPWSIPNAAVLLKINHNWDIDYSYIR